MDLIWTLFTGFVGQWTLFKRIVFVVVLIIMAICEIRYGIVHRRAVRFCSELLKQKKQSTNNKLRD